MKVIEEAEEILPDDSFVPYWEASILFPARAYSECCNV